MREELVPVLQAAGVTHTPDEILAHPAVPRPVKTLLLDAARLAEGKRSDLLGKARQVTSVVTTLVAKLDVGHSVNRLGELQNTGLQLDLLCAEYATAVDQLEGVARTWLALTADVDVPPAPATA
ncbi:hypothetical protein [Saccharothrix sp. HUAS TT1]|uniref:hypothetical protein n=1 Tax=unclassified Saccharothrix TaxID=2593673 RepID=UPI00345B8E55